MRILGIDPGSRVSGFSCIEARVPSPVLAKDFKVVDMGVVRLNAKFSHAVRITEMHSTLKTLLDEYRPQVCVIERAFCGENASSALKLGEIRGALISAVITHKVQLAEITPAQVKKIIVGNGRADKHSVAESLHQLFKINFSHFPHDATDALAIALSYGLTPTLKSNW